MTAAFLEWMPSGERIVLVGFVLIVLAVYAAAGFFLLRRIWRVIRKRERRFRRRWLRWTERGCYILAVVGLCCIFYGWMIEPYWLEVTRVEVATAKLPAGGEAIRIIHISDLHCDAKERLEDDLPAAVAKLKPDIICFTGDAVNSPAGLANFRRCMNRLAKIAPTYACWGNWEAYFPNIDYYGDTGVRVLHDQSETVTVRGQKINLAGIRYNRDVSAGLEEALTDVDGEEPTVLLCHVPSVILELEGTGVDLCLSGHTHGGQVAMPFYGALLTLSPTGKRFEQGLYLHEGTYLYINRGIGMEGGKFPRVRFFARPEVTLIELVGECLPDERLLSDGSGD